MKNPRPLLGALFCVLSLTASFNALAWGERGHSAIGMMAVEQLQPQTRARLETLLGALDMDVMAGACNWSDSYRDMGDGAETSRQHYVNIDPKEKAYLRSRDCADRQCVTEAVNDNASRLADHSLSLKERRLAFKHLCHFTGDLHTPLHVGFADDQGGNLVTIRFRGVSMSLHRYWDSGLMKQQVKSLGELLQVLRDRPDQPPASWMPLDTYNWTNETFSVTRNFAYPTTRTIDKGFEERSWQVTQQQLDVGSGRLAAILEVVLNPPETAAQ